MSTPYFYIIHHKPSGKKYAGAKWSKDADPNRLFKAGGYFTSSKTIHKLIETTGVDSFEILDILLEEEIKFPFGWNTIYEYETWFLRENRCDVEDTWLNLHCNTNLKGYGSAEYKLNIKRKYGVDNVSKHPEIIKKCVENRKLALLKKYGTLNMRFPGNNIEQRRKETMMLKYGVEHILQLPEIAKAASESARKTKFEKYGDENYNNLEKASITKKELYGNENYNNPEKRKLTNIAKYGFENHSKTEEARENLRGIIYNNPKITCENCGKLGSSPSIYRHIAICKQAH